MAAQATPSTSAQPGPPPPPSYKAHMKKAITKKKQPTIDGATAPTPRPPSPPHKVGRPRKTPEEQTAHLKRERERLRLFRKAHPGRNQATTQRSRHKASIGPRTPAEELATNHFTRVLSPKEKMASLLEWHQTSSSSFYDWEQDQTAQWEEDQQKEPEDSHRYHLIAPPPTKKRRTQYDE